MEHRHYDPRQQVVWCKAVIRNTGEKLRRKHQRWRREKPILNLVDENSEEFQNHIVDKTSVYSLNHVEWNVLMHEVLTQSERCVIRGIYIYDQSQRNLTRECLLSQAGVSRTKQRALQKLKKALT